MMEDTIHLQGMIRIRQLPQGWTRRQYCYWWCPKTDGKGHIIRASRISEQEKDRYTVLEVKNQLMVNGRTAILTYIGSTTGSTTPYGKYLALGTGVLQATSPTDTQLVNEVYRVAQNTYTIQGSQVDLNFQIPAGSAQVTITESGLFGGSASGTLNSGTLANHVLFSYTKGNYSIAIDWIINLI